VRGRAPRAGGDAGERVAMAQTGIRDAGGLQIGVEIRDRSHQADIRAVRFGGMRAPGIHAIDIARDTGDDVVARHDAAVGVHPGAPPLHRRRPIIIVLEIAFAIVDDHYRAVDRATSFYTPGTIARGGF
jgi:hypothetical protein